MRGVLTLAAVALVGAVVYYKWPAAPGDDAELTAGDEESNIFYDTVDNMTSKLTGWPTGSADYAATITEAAQQTGVPLMVLAWLLWKESRYSLAIVTGAKRSARGAMGIAQFMPATAAQELGSADAALDPDRAIPGAARYLARLYRSTGTWGQALAAYNWGIGNVQRKGLGQAPAETVDYYTTILNKAGLEATA